MGYRPLVHGDHCFHTNLVAFNRQVEIFTNWLDKRPANRSYYRVLNISGEPEAFRSPNNEIIKHHNEYNLILTWDKQILDRCPNAAFTPYRMLFIDREIAASTTLKTDFGVSFICGGKDWQPGHHLRHALWGRHNEITIPNTFWNSSAKPYQHSFPGRPLPKEPTSKSTALTSQYHITIENCRAYNYFTEKILDCLAMMVVPIYWGCPNISEFFNIDSIIICDSVDDIIRKCNQLTPEYYMKHKDSIIENHHKCMAHCIDYTISIANLIRSRI